MAAAFPRKTAALFEEFKKRELHFLNTEVNLNNNINWKNNSSLQDYMQKINKREQETERIYKELMRQMENLEKQSDQMTLKLEKLNALRNVALSFNVSDWPSTDGTHNRPFQSYYSGALTQTTPKMLSSGSPIQDFPLRIQPDLSLFNHLHQFSFSKLNCHSIATQTEYIFCDNCHFPLILNSGKPISNTNLDLKTTYKTTNKNDEKNFPTETQENDNYSIKTGIVKSATEDHNLISKLNYSISDPQTYDHDDSMFTQERMSSGVSDISFKDQEIVNEKEEMKMPESRVDNAVIDKLADETFQKRMSESYAENAAKSGLTNEPFEKRMSKNYIDNIVSDELINVPAQKRMSKSYIDNAVTGDYVTHTEEKQYVEIQDTDLLSNDGNFEQTISKSDEESMSHEFNFLDLDKSKNPRRHPVNQMSGDKNSQLAESVEHNERHGNIQFESGYATQSNSNHLLKVQQTSGSSEKIGVSREDLSYSIGPPSPSAHSENTTVVSESDSSSEKDTPLTATAAYQALLGNVSVTKPKRSSVPISDSDSDEIENALANVVRRTSHIAFDTAISDAKSEKRKEGIAELKVQKDTKPVDSASTKKPQNKLSKNTRKVLGLDTSSGSEMELEVKGATSKIEEESDEFDFYD